MEKIMGIAVLLALGLSIFTQVVVVIFGNILGGFKFGSLKRSVELDVDTDEFPDFEDMFYERATGIGFTQTGTVGDSETIFMQSGAAGEALLGLGTHAKTKKELRLRVEEVSAEKRRVTLTLAYTDPIVADTGECAYRDAVLDYLLGRSDEMIIVPTESHSGLCCFAGSLIAALIMGVNLALNIRLLDWTIPFYCFTSIVLGITASIAILMKPQEIKGLILIFFGIFLNTALIACAAIKLFMQRV